MSDENKTVESPEESLVSQEQEGSASDKKEILTDNTPKNEDGLLIEEDGDFFWIFQKVAWGVLKTVVIFGVLGFLIWQVWDTPKDFLEPEDPITEDSLDVASIPNPKPIEKERGPIPATASSKASSQGLVDIIYTTEKLSQKNAVDTIGRSMAWLKNTQNLGRFSIESIRRIENPQIRAQKIEQIIAEGEQLLVEKKFLDTHLKNELLVFSRQRDEVKNQALSFDEQTFAALMNNNQSQFPGLKKDLITAQKEYSRLRTEAELREVLVKNMDNFERLLRQKVLPLFLPETQITERK